MRSRRRTIIITGLLAILISYIVMNPKKSDKLYFTLYIGDKAEQIEMTDDWDGTLETIMTRLQPLWNNLEKGESEIFYIEREDNAQPDWYDASEYNTEGKKLTFTSSTSSSKYRFFKNRKSTPIALPIFGYERVGDDGEVSRLAKSNSSKWGSMQMILSTRLEYMKEDIVLPK